MVKKSLRVRQRDLSDCGAACIASVCAYYGRHVSVSRIRQYAGTNKEGTSVFGLKEAALRLGFDTVAAKASFDSLYSVHLPAIVQVIINKKLSHYVVVVHINSCYVTVMDPAEGTFKKLLHSEFKEIWTGVIVLVTPSDTFIKVVRQSGFRRFYDIARPGHKALLGALVCAILVSVLGLTTSIYMQKIIDQVLTAGDISLLHLISSAMIVLLVLQTVIGIIKDMLALSTSRRIDSKLIMGYYRHVLHLPQRFYDNMRAGEMISRVNDAVKINAFINDVAINLVVNVLVLICSFTAMFFYYWKLALVLLLIIPVYAVLFYCSDRINKKWQRRLMESGADLEAQLVESFSTAATIRQLSLENTTSNKTKKRLTRLLNTVYESSVYQVLINSGADFFTHLFTIIILWVGSNYVIGGQLTAGELLSFYALMHYFTSPVAGLMGASRYIREALIAADRLFEITDLDTEKSGELIPEPQPNTEIIFENVSFSYDNGKEILKNTNLTITGGSITGLSGESGCGKSTVAFLLQKLYDPAAGNIRINGMDIADINNGYLRKLVTAIPQHTDLFAGTVIENITWGCKVADRKKVESICEDLGISSFINNLPDGFDTLIQEQGCNLSGGQQQRIAIARALYRDPSVLIMDEATASIDPPSAQRVMLAIERYRQKGNTVLLIAHSSAVLDICDTVLVLQNGEISVLP